MTASIPLESDSLSPLMCESVPYPMIVECPLTVRNNAVFGFMDKISVPLYLLVNLLLRGVTFFFCPMLMDIVNAGHLMCFEAHNVTIGVLYVLQVISRTTRLSTLLRSSCKASLPHLLAYARAN